MWRKWLVEGFAPTTCRLIGRGTTTIMSYISVHAEFVRHGHLQEKKNKLHHEGEFVRLEFFSMETNAQ